MILVRRNIVLLSIVAIERLEKSSYKKGLTTSYMCIFGAAPCAVGVSRWTRFACTEWVNIVNV